MTFFNTLSNRDKQISEYYYKENMIINEIAKIINSYISTVFNAKDRAIKKAEKIWLIIFV